MSNSGGSEDLVVAGITMMFSAIVRACGRWRFSGTDTVPQRAWLSTRSSVQGFSTKMGAAVATTRAAVAANRPIAPSLRLSVGTSVLSDIVVLA
jgi:hypothetical protein